MFFLSPVCLILYWYCMEKFSLDHSRKLKVRNVTFSVPGLAYVFKHTGHCIRCFCVFFDSKSLGMYISFSLCCCVITEQTIAVSCEIIGSLFGNLITLSRSGSRLHDEGSLQSFISSSLSWWYWCWAYLLIQHNEDAVFKMPEIKREFDHLWRRGSGMTRSNCNRHSRYEFCERFDASTSQTRLLFA